MLSALLVLAAEIGGFLLVFTALAIPAILVHEMGHAAAGLIAGLEVLSVRVGPMELRRKKDWALSFKKHGLRRGWVGAQFRRLPDRWAAWRCFAFFIGGPLANLFAAPVLWRFSGGNTPASTFAGYLSFLCVGLGVGNLIPMQTKFGYSDGAKIGWLLFNRRRRHELILGLSLKVRVGEITSLLRSNERQQALDAASNLVSMYEKSSIGDAEGLELLRRLHASVQKCLAETAAVTTGANATSS